MSGCRKDDCLSICCDGFREKIEYLIRVDGSLRVEINKLKESGFLDMKNELIAFKAERNELRSRIDKIESNFEKKLRELCGDEL